MPVYLNTFLWRLLCDLYWLSGLLPSSVLSLHQPAKLACSDAARQRTIAVHQHQLAANQHRLAVHQHQRQFAAQLQHLFAANLLQLQLAANLHQLAANQLRRGVACSHEWAAAKLLRALAATKHCTYVCRIVLYQSECPLDARFLRF